jgi:tetratricopeptide (TPR) repeat protein
MEIIGKNLRFLYSLVMILLVVVSCKNDKKNVPSKPKETVEKPVVFKTPLGKEFIVPAPSEKLLRQYEEAKTTFEAYPDSVEAIIWYGRRTAYLGRYEEAISIYSQGIEKYPEEPRFYRHRGHRQISLRNFDAAISDLEKAGQLIQGTDNEIEPDGMPNAKNIPVSTLHGNIWYHLGLAYYLKHDYEKAYEAYLKCRESGSLPDNIVSSTHWLYMIQRRLGNPELADEMLVPISLEMDVIENQSYYELCKLYKGLIPVDSLLQTETGSPSNDAVAYGLANWYFYNGEKEKAQEIMTGIVDSSSWSSFGYIAAESDLLHYYGK